MQSFIVICWQFATVVDISWENPEKMAQKKPPRRDVPSQGQKELADTRPTGSFDETRVAHPKRPRKRKLTKELEKCDVQAASSKGESKKPVTCFLSLCFKFVRL